MSLVSKGKSSINMRIRDLENVLRHRRIPYPKRSVEFIALIAISCTLFLFLHTKNLNSRLKEMEVKLQPSEFSALGLTGDNHIDESKHHHDRNTLHGTYQYLKSTGQLDYLDRSSLNNTPQAEKSLIFFNRVAKVGSESLMELIDELGKLHEFEVYTNEPKSKNRVTLPDDEQKDLAEAINELNEFSVYIEHVNHINFTKFDMPRPIYINLVRDPVERVISWFFYVRGSYSNAIKYQKFPNMPLKPEKWFKKDFNHCVRTGDPECVYEQLSTGGGGDYRRQSHFFCGHDKDCLPFNSKTAIQIAKKVVEKDYAVVGSWEDTNVTLTVLEKYIPRFFKGAHVLYNIHKDRIVNQNKNRRKPKIYDDVKAMIRKNFTEEIDFYHFCKQRLYKQYIALKLDDIRATGAFSKK